jgi:hypothetical protein
MRAYMRWKMDAYLRAHPELPPPREAILFMHVYRTPEFGKPLDWTRAEICVARWRINDSAAPGTLPLEVCDPLTGQFVSLPAEGSVSHE